MKRRSLAVKLVCVALLAAGALQISASGAMAAKEQFTRNKPHVNVGSTGSTSPQSGTGDVTSSPSQPTGDGPDGACDAEKKTGSSGAPPAC
jgi:hypothetical protein